MIAVMEEGEISAKGEGFSAEMGKKSPKGRASPVCPGPGGPPGKPRSPSLRSLGTHAPYNPLPLL